ncbi:MAG: TldD/PmbA family protein [Gemmatimonadota bacterium]|nr:TldD/PmbA family protein [Gemmatimonadota bacterium]
MIGILLEEARRRTTGADLTYKSDETTTLELRGGRVSSARVALSHGVSLRVQAGGRIGIAGATDDDAQGLLSRALASAAAGEAGQLALPGPSVWPAVGTHVARAATATVSDLAAPAQLLRDRLGTERLRVAASVSRSLGSVQVANSAGLGAAYDVTTVTLRLEATRMHGDRRLTLLARRAGADLPPLADLERWVAQVRQRLAWAERQVDVPSRVQRVGFLPSTMEILLEPVQQALVGRAALHGASPLARRRGTRVYSPEFSLVDDPLVDGRPGSRPFDDEGTPCRPLPLIERGVVENLIYDLETATRVGTTATGHARRTTFGKAQAAFSNLVLSPGTASWAGILEAIGDGLLVEQLASAGSMNLAGGAFSRVALVAWRVEGGEVTGLAPEVTIAGNAHELLGRIVAIGEEQVWIGSRAAPTVVLDGVTVY